METIESPMHWMDHNGELDHIKALIAKGSDVNQKNVYGNTPLDAVIYKLSQNNFFKVIKTLIEAGAENGDEKVFEALQCQP